MLFQIHFKSVLSPWLWEWRPKYLITVCYERTYNWGGRYHCSAIFMGPLLNKVALPCSCKVGLGLRSSLDWWVVVGRNEMYRFRVKHLTSKSRNVNSLHPYGGYLDSTCCGSDIRLRAIGNVLSHRENCVLKGCMNLQWILREEVIFSCVKSL